MKHLLAILCVLLFPLGVWAETAKLIWAPNPETDLAGYKVHRGNLPCPATGTQQGTIDVGNVTTYLDTTIPATWTDICYWVTAYDATGNESPLSLPAGKVLLVPVSPPTQVVFAHGGATGGGVFSFTKNPLAAKTKLYVHEAGTPYDCVTQTFCGEVISPRIVLTMKWATGYDCWLTSLDALGNESPGGAGVACSMPVQPPIVIPPPDTIPPGPPSNFQVTKILDIDRIEITALPGKCLKLVTTGQGLKRVIRCAH